jgi:NAD kinase
MSTPRVVVVHRRTEYAELIARHGTRGQAAFFLASRERSLDEVEARHQATEEALVVVHQAIPSDWRRAQVEREELSRFVFGPEDVIAVVGQDGLVANVAKYVQDQVVVGIDPLPGTNAGVLVPHAAADAGALLRAAVAGSATVLERTMVDAVADDGQQLTALNEIFVGQPTHQTARYTLEVNRAAERQASSGIIVGTGTGATGWCASLQRQQAPELRLPQPDAATLAWFVREPWPSPSTGADLTAGVLVAEDNLVVRVESDSLVVFGDGMETDRLTLSWGQELRIQRASRVLRTIA